MLKNDVGCVIVWVKLNSTLFLTKPAQFHSFFLTGAEGMVTMGSLGAYDFEVATSTSKKKLLVGA